MKKKGNNITLLNVISNVILQIVTIISGFVIPHIILNIFGSEVNGLTSSLNNLLNYISIFEGGLGGVILANLYKPLYNKDYKQVGSIVRTTSKFYRKLASVLIIYTIIVSILYPIFSNTSFSFAYISLLTIILSVTLFIQYNYSLSHKLLLQADKKVYIVSNTQSVLTFINIVIFYVLAKIIPNIHILKISSALIFILQPIIYNHFVKKYYDINFKKAEINKNILKSRWDGFAINIAGFIHGNTDIFILTFLTNLKVVSVYSIYGLVVSGLRRILQSVSSAITPTIGIIYASDNKEELNRKFELFEYIMFILVFFFFSVGGLLITPFVLLYTKNITDISYNEPIMGYILMLAEGMYCIREPYVSLAYSANKFKEIKWPAYFEAIINIIISVVLVFKFGLIGVAIGTFVAMTYRTLFHVHYFKNNVINRSTKYFYIKMLIFSIFTSLGIIICKLFVPFIPTSIINWILCAIIYSIIFVILYIIASLLFFKTDINYFLNKFIKHTKN